MAGDWKPIHQAQALVHGQGAEEVLAEVYILVVALEKAIDGGSGEGVVEIDDGAASGGA